MGLFWKNSDERLIAKFEKEEKRMLMDNYDLKHGKQPIRKNPIYSNQKGSSQPLMK